MRKGFASLWVSYQNTFLKKPTALTDGPLPATRLVAWIQRLWRWSQLKPRHQKTARSPLEKTAPAPIHSGSFASGDKLPVWIICAHDTRKGPDVFLLFWTGLITFNQIALSVADHVRQLANNSNGKFGQTRCFIKRRFINGDFLNTNKLCFNRQALFFSRSNNRFKGLKNFRT